MSLDVTYKGLPVVYRPNATHNIDTELPSQKYFGSTRSAHQHTFTGRPICCRVITNGLNRSRKDTCILSLIGVPGGPVCTSISSSEGRTSPCRSIPATSIPTL